MPQHNPHADHHTVVTDWRQNAAARDEENYEFLRSLKSRDYGFEPDELAGELHRRAFEIVDCTRCANCCKTLAVRFSEADIERIAGFLNMPVEEFIETYLEWSDELDSYRAREKPCPFLGDDDRCTIYDDRPEVCRGYPYTDREDFTTRTISIADNALACPAVYWIVEQMKQRASG